MSRPVPATPGNRDPRAGARPPRATPAVAGLLAAVVVLGAGSGLWAVRSGLGLTALGWPSAAAAAATLGGSSVRAVAEGDAGRPDLLLTWSTGSGPRRATAVPLAPGSAMPPAAADGSVAASGPGRAGTPVAAGRTRPKASPAGEPAPPSGLAHSVTVVLVQPPGTQRDATTAAALATSIRTDVSSFWSGQTRGAVTFTVPKAIDWVTVTARCTDVWGLWNQAAAAAGFVPGLRKHLVVYVAPGGHCSPGLGTIGSGPEAGGYVYLRATKVALLAHELGHNLGLGHSNGLQCDTAADAVWTGHWSRPCTVTDYRDWYDVMGVSWDRLGTLSTAQAYHLGVLPPAQVATLTGTGQVTLQPVSATRGLVSLRVTDPSGVTYVVEYRPATGREAWLGSRALDWRGLRPGVLVRRTDPTRGTDLDQTLLLDASPSRPAAYADDFDEPLVTGRVLTLGSGRLALKVTDAGPASATVAVAVDGVWPGSALARLGGRVPGTASSTVDPSPVAVPWIGPAPAQSR